MSEPCQWCGIEHGPRCPLIKAMEFRKAGSIRRVEFFSAIELAPLRQSVNEPEQPYPKLGDNSA